MLFVSKNCSLEKVAFNNVKNYVPINNVKNYVPINNVKNYVPINPFPFEWVLRALKL